MANIVGKKIAISSHLNFVCGVNVDTNISILQKAIEADKQIFIVADTKEGENNSNKIIEKFSNNDKVMAVHINELTDLDKTYLTQKFGYKFDEAIKEISCCVDLTKLNADKIAAARKAQFENPPTLIQAMMDSAMELKQPYFEPRVKKPHLD